MTERVVPSKRLRNWHRIHRAAGSFAGSLRSYARSLVAVAAEDHALPSDHERAGIARRWLASKGARLVLAVAMLCIAIRPSSADCGEERSAVKLGLDADVARVVPHPVAASIADLALSPRPGKTPEDRRAGETELTVYTVRATVAGYKLEADGDYHIVLADEHGRTMIVEIPRPSCAASGRWGSQVAAARAGFEQLLADRHLPRPSAKLHATRLPIDVTGVGFFDKIHGQSGVARNGIELHPVLAIGGGS